MKIHCKFFRLLLSDLSMAILSKKFLLASSLVVFFYILGTIDSIAECIQYGSEITVFDMHSMATFSTFSILNYVLCAIPYANSFSNDYQSNYFRSVIMRSSKRGYAVSKVIATAISGSLCLIIGELVYMLICSFFGGAVSVTELSELNTGSTEAFSNIANFDMLLNSNYIGYFVLLAIHRGLIGSFLSLIGLGVSLKIQNVFVIISSPMLIYYFIENLLMNFLKLPQIFNVANIFDGRISVIDSRYMFLYSLSFALAVSFIIGVFVARGIERKLLYG